ncbi:amine oxidase [Capsulimonas corticalis]|uniref:Amine oxidase n=1 Tax=Capsulimonas corticalis TaxID=2219043 RepID=A0A402D1J4_9BACT|nr:primary-amine oxidase [Capsulimonas corticalis]BDI28655.1 amine oxidase [Capsulimonas corticalis]
MATTGSIIEAVAAPPRMHPLEPLSGEEIAAAAGVLRASGLLGDKMRFVLATLAEPAKEVVYGWTAETAAPREAAVQILDNADGKTYEAVVSLTDMSVVRWEHIPGVQPSVMLDEFFECEEGVKNSPEFQAALAKRGISDMSLVMVDPWSAGWYGGESASYETRRVLRAMAWLRAETMDNGYARPIEGVAVIYDLNEQRVLEVIDTGVVALPPEPGNYSREYVSEFSQTGGYRADLKPFEVAQPDGPSFTVDGHHVTWQKWSFRIGFTPREGLVLYTVGYEDGGKARPILYRAALCDMVVPYGDPGYNHYHKNAFDCGEYGIGMLANALELGCDCLGEIRYFDAFMTSSRGEPVKLPNAVCMHEEDFGILWKHVDWRNNHTEVRRSRRLVVSFIATVGNYEYGFFWYFYQDGTIQYEIKLTGIMNTSALPPGETRKYGSLLAPGLYAPNHEHIFNIRMDMMVDGPRNSVQEVHCELEPEGPDNPAGNGYYAQATTLKTEHEAQQLVDPLRGRYWKIVNPHSINRLGLPVSYKLMPGENSAAFQHPSAYVSKRAGYMSKHLWVTPFDADELYATGKYPNQSQTDAGLPMYTQGNRPIEDTDLVVWYTLAHNHIPRPEDWPVMPVGYVGFMLKPVGFFDRNPALDVPPTESKRCHGIAQETGGCGCSSSGSDHKNGAH